MRRGLHGTTLRIGEGSPFHDTLGPTVLDRLIQQALIQVLQPLFDPGFSEHSYGFRLGRRAHDAVRRAQRTVQEGRRWVVDVDVERCFDRVHHDVLMGKLANRIADKRVLRLIPRYLRAGVLSDGVVTERHEGTPQGGPLSPLLANVLLDWIRHRLRAIQLKQWKRDRTTYRELTARGVTPATAALVAATTHRWWRTSALALHCRLPNRLFDEPGLPRLSA